MGNSDRSLAAKIRAILKQHSNLKKMVYYFFCLLNSFERLFLNSIGYIPVNTFRHLFYKMFGLKMGHGSVIHFKAEIRDPSKISIGNNTIVGDFCILDGREGIVIGNNVNLSSGVWIWTLQHNHEDPLFGTIGGKVSIEDYVWISCRCTIIPNVKIGYGAVICAGSVVTHDVEPYNIVAGVPAKPIGLRTKDLKYTLENSTSFL